MSDTQLLMKKAEGYVQWRRSLLVVNALAYIGWIGSTGMGYLHTVAIEPSVLNLVAMICWPIWLLSLLGIFAQMRYGRKHGEISRLADDERTVSYTKTAFQTGYWLLLVALAGVYAASYFIELDIKAVIPFMLALGVAAPSLTYALMDRG